MLLNRLRLNYVQWFNHVIGYSQKEDAELPVLAEE